MKKFLALLLALVMSLSLVACGGGDDTAADGGADAEDGGNAETAAYQVAMITDYGDITDQSFNQTTYEACQEFCDAEGLQFEYYKLTTLLGQCLQAGHPSFLLWKETFKTELLIRQSGSHQCRYKSCRSRQALHFDAVTHTLSDYQKARVGYTRCTCIRNQSYSFSPLYSINNTFLQEISLQKM